MSGRRQNNKIFMQLGARKHRAISVHVYVNDLPDRFVAHCPRLTLAEQEVNTTSARDGLLEPLSRGFCFFRLRISCRRDYSPTMPKRLDHPNEPGQWTLLERTGVASLWRRDRSDPFPVSLYYLIAPPRQTEVLYGEAKARAQFSDWSASDANQAA